MERIGKYAVRSVIVATDYSTVYQCVDPDLRVGVAVKLFDLKGRSAGPQAIHGPEHWRERFVREARLLARLDHPHVIAVKELGTSAEGKPYFVMPLVEASLVWEIGRDARDEHAPARLPEELRPRAIAPARALQLLRQLLSALAYLHARGLVHRDLKPANLLLTRRRGGSVKLTDFGMVKYPDWSDSRAGVWLGTLDYIAPEQRENAAGADARADVYAAAAVAYRMLTGRLAAGRFPSLTELGLGVPRALDDLLMACLSPARASRPADGAAMLTKLDAALRPAAPAKRRVARVVAISKPQNSRP